MAQRWGNGSPERKIEAFIGAWGVKTGDIANTDHLLELASRLFEVANNGLADRMLQAIDALGPKGRKALAQKNLKSVMGGEGRFSADWNQAADTGRPVIPAESLQRMMDASTPKMVDGHAMDIDGLIDVDPAQLLRKVVSAVISAGRGDILWEFPEVLSFFNARIPDRSELAGHHNVDERMFEAKAKWPNVKTPRDIEGGTEMREFNRYLQSAADHDREVLQAELDLKENLDALQANLLAVSRSLSSSAVRSTCSNREVFERLSLRRDGRLPPAALRLRERHTPAR